MHQTLFFLLLALIPVQLGYHFWPEWTLVLGRRIDYLSPTLYLTDIFIFLIISLWFLEKKKIFSLWLVLLCAAVNIFFAQSKPIAFFAWIKVAEYVLLGLYIQSTKPNYQQSLFYLSIGVFYTSIIGILQFVLQHSIGGFFWFFGERTFNISTPGIAKITTPLLLRSYSTFSHPNVYGGYLAILLPLFLSQRKNKFYFFIFLLGIIALILTFSRSAWIVCAIGILLLKRMHRGIIFSILLFILFFLFFPRISDVSVTNRVALAQTAFSIWQSYPLFGVGLGNFLVTLPHFYHNRDIFFLQPVHNIYLLLLSEVGVVVFLPLLLFFKKNMSIPLFCLLILGLFDHYPLTLQQGQLLLVITIFLLQSPHAQDNRDKHPLSGLG